MSPLDGTPLIRCLALIWSLRMHSQSIAQETLIINIELAKDDYAERPPNSNDWK